MVRYEEWFGPGIPKGLTRLVCFPYAGGSASLFRGWRGKLGPDVDVLPVRLPGRESRSAEPVRTNLAALASELAEAIVALPGLSTYVLFGHSMGASLAYEIAGNLEGTDHEPLLVALSAHRAPTEPVGELIHGLDPDEFRERAIALGGFTPAVLEHAELMDLVLPTLRGDITAIETHAPSGRVLRSDIAVFYGTSDPYVGSTSVDGWRNYTAGAFTVAPVPGDHFYLSQPAGEATLLSHLRNLVSTVGQR